MKEITTQYIAIMAARKKNEQVEKEIVSNYQTDIFGHSSLMLWGTAIGAPIATIALGPWALVPFVAGWIYTSVKTFAKSEAVLKYASQSKIMDSLIIEYGNKLDFPSEDVYAAFVTGDFKEMEKLVHEYNTNSKNEKKSLIPDNLFGGQAKGLTDKKEETYEASKEPLESMMYG